VSIGFTIDLKEPSTPVGFRSAIGLLGLAFTQHKMPSKHDTHGMEAARLVGRRVAKTGVLLKIGRTTLADKAKIGTSWASMQVPLVKGGDQ
jgi:hypothetical protein